MSKEWIPRVGDVVYRYYESNEADYHLGDPLVVIRVENNEGPLAEELDVKYNLYLRCLDVFNPFLFNLDNVIYYNVYGESSNYVFEKHIDIEQVKITNIR